MGFAQSIDEAALGQVADPVRKQEDMLPVCRDSCRQGICHHGLEGALPLPESLVLVQNPGNTRCDLLAGHVGQVGGVLRRFLQLLQILESPAAAEDRQADAAPFAEGADDLDHADLAGPVDVRRTAGADVNAWDLHQAERPVDLLFAAIGGFFKSLFIRIPGADLQIVPYNAVGGLFQPEDVLIGKRTVEIQGDGIVAQMKAHIVVAEFTVHKP